MRKTPVFWYQRPRQAYIRPREEGRFQTQSKSNLGQSKSLGHETSISCCSPQRAALTGRGRPLGLSPPWHHTQPEVRGHNLWVDPASVCPTAATLPAPCRTPFPATSESAGPSAKALSTATRRTMQFLNDRLASYLEKVRGWSGTTRELESRIRELSKCPESTAVRTIRATSASSRSCRRKVRFVMLPIRGGQTNPRPKSPSCLGLCKWLLLCSSAESSSRG